MGRSTFFHARFFPRGKRLAYGLLVVASAPWCLSNCATTVTTYTAQGHEETRTVEEFRAYVKEVFRRQNQAVSEVMFLLAEGVGEPAREALGRAEQNLQRACEPLNDIAVLKRDRVEVDLDAKLKVKESVTACDGATRRVEALLRRVKKRKPALAQPPARRQP